MPHAPRATAAVLGCRVDGDAGLFKRRRDEPAPASTSAHAPAPADAHAASARPPLGPSSPSSTSPDTAALRDAAESQQAQVWAGQAESWVR